MPVDMYNPATGQATGELGSWLLQNDMDINSLRIYRGRDGHAYMDKLVGNNSDGTPKYEAVRVNNDSALPWETWRWIDTAVVDAARAEPRLLNDFNQAGLGVTIDAMSVTAVTYQKRVGAAHARIGMDPSVRSERDRSKSSIANTPIPFIYSDWQFPLRDIRIAERGGVGLDTEQIREATRVVLETADDIILGTSATPFDYDGMEMPGILNFADAIPYVITSPLAGGWAPSVLYNQINAMRQLSIDNNYPGPWMLYFGSAWDYHLNLDYTPAYPGPNLRDKIASQSGISGIRMLRRLTNDFRVIMIQMTQSVFRLYNGMPLRAIRWTSLDGFNVYGKVIMSVAPQPRSDALGQTGIVIGATA